MNIGVRKHPNMIFKPREWANGYKRLLKTRFGQVLAMAGGRNGLDAGLMVQPALASIFAVLGRVKLQLGLTYTIPICGLTLQMVAESSSGKSISMKIMADLSEEVYCFFFKSQQLTHITHHT